MVLLVCGLRYGRAGQHYAGSQACESTEMLHEPSQGSRPSQQA
jgi:hypothetical protein